MYNPYPLYRGGLCSYGLGSGYSMPSTKVVFYVQPLPAISGWAVQLWLGNRPSPVPNQEKQYMLLILFCNGESNSRVRSEGN
jgi:hypothetical protein